MAFHLLAYLVFGSAMLIHTAHFANAYTNVRWEAFMGSCFVLLSVVAASALLSTRPTITSWSLGALVGGTGAFAFLFIFSVGIILMVLLIPLLIAVGRTISHKDQQKMALLAAGLAFVTPFIGLYTLYH